jgi:hypothetical protein
VAVYNGKWDTLANADYSLKDLSLDKPTWLQVNLPDTQITGKFYVRVYKNLSAYVIGIGADDSISNEHSTVTEVKSDGTFAEPKSWPFDIIDKKKANWMIHVLGTVTVTQE